MPFITFERFLQALVELNHLPWQITPTGQIRFEEDGGVVYDPLTAVCEHVTGLYFQQSGRSQAGMKLGFLPPMAELIIQACDNLSQDPQVQARRAQILEALILEECHQSRIPPR